MSKASAKNIVPTVVLAVILCGLAAMIGYAVSLKYRSVPNGAEILPDATEQGRVVVLRTAVPETPSPEPTIAPVLFVEADPAPDQKSPFWSEGSLVFENEYRSPTLSVSVATHADSKTFNKPVVYYVADVYVSDVTQIRTAAAGGDFARSGSGKMLNVSRKEDALIAVSGDYFSAHKGLVIRNGEVYRKKISSWDICLLLRNGEMETIRSGDVTIQSILEKDPWQAWQFGPSLLDDSGRARKTFSKTVISPANPRCCIGYYEPGHYCFVLVDGRQKASRGLSLIELASLMESLGCKRAYNLDGGASAHMYWQDRVFNHPSGGGRKIADIIYVAKESYPSVRFYYGKGGQSQ